MTDKRPMYLIESVKESVCNNLALVQELTRKSNNEMAQILGIKKKYYEKVKKNGGPLNYDRLNQLYYELHIDLNRFIANDLKYDLIRDTNAYSKREIPTYKVHLNDIFNEIECNEDYDESIEMLMEIYMKLGNYIRKLLINQK